MTALIRRVQAWLEKLRNPLADIDAGELGRMWMRQDISDAKYFGEIRRRARR